MPFDLATAKPFENNGFDLSTAKPVDQPQQMASTNASTNDPDPVVKNDTMLVPDPYGNMDNLQKSPLDAQHVQNVKQMVGNVVRPVLEAGGAIGGGIIGSAEPVGGTLAGGALGYAAGKNIADLIFDKENAKTIPGALMKTAKDVATGAEMEMSGPIIGKVGGQILQGAGRLGKEVLGATTGAGPGMVEEAMKGGEKFQEAMRGGITGNEVVDNAMGALHSIRDNRMAGYQSSLESISQIKGDIDATPIADSLSGLMKRFNIKMTPEGPDFSRIAMGKTGRNDIEEIVQKVSEWGSKEGDFSPMGLDVLKRQLDDFYSDSSQARSFVSQIRNAVKDTISNEIPEYGEMTKSYAEATDMIKDIESNLMMRKNGMTGRITPDQTLRRLSSSMRENFEMRRDLVNLLGDQSGQDMSGQIAGYSANQLIPRGLIGKVSAGSAGALAYMNPQFWPLLAASSPRAVGEFLVQFGKGAKLVENTAPVINKAAGYGVGKAIESNNQEQQ